MNQIKQYNTDKIKLIAESIGFDQCGIAIPVSLDEDAKRLERWLMNNHHGEMHYMENHFDMRVDPTKLVPGAKSVITLLFNYYPTEVQDEGNPKIAKYAYGKDYHEIIRNKLHEFLYKAREIIGDIQGRGFVDSAPVLERAWAQKSGLGWIGKNGNLINKKMGSFFFIATLITDLELIADLPYPKDYCGSCNKCVEACPTEAILPNKVIDATKCISYFTIELKSPTLPAELEKNAQNWIFGCDICQDVCPWNTFSTPTKHIEFSPLQEVISFSIEDWMDLEQEKFNTIFKQSAIKRTKWDGMMRNLKLFIHND
ncbi:MAG: tRNA epoxyqueuosine(34) reductase QueG [Chitinophagaceae bacterium]|nr:MAG: tRNA epoxyqueuosine(34) reductase QueG [Chitinophagaceae bacterium]